MQKIGVLAMALVFLAGCKSVELAEVDEFAPETPINSPEQAKRLIEEHTPRHPPVYRQDG